MADKPKKTGKKKTGKKREKLIIPSGIVHVLASGNEVTASVPIEPAFQRGDTVSVTFPADRLHLFDGSSEANLLAALPAY